MQELGEQTTLAHTLLIEESERRESGNNNKQELKNVIDQNKIISNGPHHCSSARDGCL
jgi:hypothetical protein